MKRSRERLKQRKKTEESRAMKQGMALGSILVTVAIVVVFVMAVQKGRAQDAEKKPQTAQTTATEKWQEGVITYKGKSYKYNNRIDTYLLMGIDKPGVVEKTEDYTKGGQSDAIFLLVIDKEAEEFSVISINRNTMTDIEEYSSDGSPMGTFLGQICLAHAYGDGKRLSCRRTQDAVSAMFDQLPIAGYLALQMDGISIINDGIGGVEVTCLQDLSYPDAGVSLSEGETVKLSGREAYYYLRGRDMNTFDSATMRLRRQEQYINSFMKTLRGLPAKKDTLSTMYENLADYIVTDISFVDLLADFAEYELTEDHIYTVPGETVMGEQFEEFYIDEEALYDLIIEVFYNEVPAEEADG